MGQSLRPVSLLGLVVRGGGALLVSILAGWLLLSIAYCIPYDWIEGNVASARQQVDAEGDYPESYVDGVPLDNFTVRGVLRIAASEQTSSPIIAAVETGQYYRYWHGYTVLLRPLLIFLTLTDIRMLLQFAVLMLITILVICLVGNWGRRGVAPALIVTASYFIYGAAQASACLPFFPSLALSMVFSIGVLRLRKISKRSVACVFLLCGIAVAYTDFLDTPIVALLVPLSLLTWRMSVDGDEGAALLATIATCIIAWGFGFFGMWAGKWLLASAVLQVNAVGDAIHQAAFRTGMLESEDPYNANAFSAIVKNAAVCPVGSFMIICSAIVCLFACLAAGIKGNRRDCLIALGFLICAALPYVWYAVLSNHSVIHYWFTYRSQLASLIALALGVDYALMGWIAKRRHEPSGTCRDVGAMRHTFSI